MNKTALKKELDQIKKAKSELDKKAEELRNQCKESKEYLLVKNILLGRGWKEFEHEEDTLRKSFGDDEIYMDVVLGTLEYPEYIFTVNSTEKNEPLFEYNNTNHYAFLNFIETFRMPKEVLSVTVEIPYVSEDKDSIKKICTQILYEAYRNDRDYTHTIKNYGEYRA